MTYWMLDLIFLGTVAVVAIVALTVRRRPRWASVLLSGGVVLIMTAIFDNVMIGIGLVGYNPLLISGIFVGAAPVEDFSYAVAAVVLLPSLWSLIGDRYDQT